MKKSNLIYAVLAGIALAILINTILVSRKELPAIKEITPTPTPEDFGMVKLLDRYNWLDTTQKVKPEVETPLMVLIDAAEANGKCLVVSSGFRTLEQQAKVKAKYGDLAEEPGKSEHQTGLAVDLQACPMTDGERDDEAERLELAKPFNELPEYRWLKKNAGKYGFTQSYENETWHWKFTGITPSPQVVAPTESKVSWYGQEYCDKYNPACLTASGEKFDDTKLTVACSQKHKIGDTFKITYGEKTVVARCNDRGSFNVKYNREMDLSKATFATLAPLSKGVIAVKIEKLK